MQKIIDAIEATLKIWYRMERCKVTDCAICKQTDATRKVLEEALQGTMLNP